MCSSLMFGDSFLSADEGHVLVIVGAGGTDEYTQTFSEWSHEWAVAAEKAGVSFERIGVDDNAQGSDRERMLEALQRAGTNSNGTLWLVLLGHGTFDGQTARFNLRGPDIAAAELAAALRETTRPLVVVNASSASGPFINALSAPGRVIVTATKNGFEVNYARFGGYFAAAIHDPRSDLDKDDQVSVLEAFLAAAAQVNEFYEGESRLATEHALLDDNGDQLGTPVEFFRGVRAVRAPREGHAVDGVSAHRLHLVRSTEERQLPEELRGERDALEQQLEELRQRKSELSSEDYDQQLESILLKLAELYMRSEAQQ